MPAIRIAVLATLCAIFGAASAASQAPLDPAQAAAVFRIADAVAREDGGRLRGVSLAGPIAESPPDKTRGAS